MPEMIEVVEGGYTFAMHDREAVYRFILRYKLEKSGQTPVYKAIMEECGVGSLSTVHNILQDLQEAGKIVIETRMGSRPIIRIPGERWLPPAGVEVN